MPTDDSSRELDQRVAGLLQDSRFRAAIRRIMADSGLSDDTGERIRFDLPAQDQMLAHSLRQHGHAAFAVSQYFNISIQQFNCLRQVAESAFDTAPENLRVLDFACGYGRLLRFLSAWLPRHNVRGAEIQPHALESNRRLFGVGGYRSEANPDALRVDRRFDLIWVASLFSHLPDALFRGWLRALHGLLAPDGVLCFSVRDASLFRDPAAIARSGFAFEAESERIPIDSSIYGTAWASEDYVREAIAASIEGRVSCPRIPRALAMEQDLYLLSSSTRRSPLDAASFRRGPWGWVDRLERDRRGRLRIDGWAGAMDHSGIEAVEVRVDGRIERIVPDVERGDVADVFSSAALRRSGFAYESTLGDPEASCFVDVTAVGRHRERALLYAGPAEIDDNGGAA